jgi:hypothetical protein
MRCGSARAKGRYKRKGVLVEAGAPAEAQRELETERVDRAYSAASARAITAWTASYATGLRAVPMILRPRILPA